MTRFVPKSTKPLSRLGRNVGLTLRAPAPLPEIPEQVVGVAPCVPNITGLVWIDPSDESQTDTAVLMLQNVTTQYGPGDFLTHDVPANDWSWEARILGDLCCDCEVNWSIEWSGDEGLEPGYRFRWDWGILYPRTGDSGNRLDHGSGVLTVSAEIVCPDQTINVGPITAVVGGGYGS